MAAGYFFTGEQDLTPEGVDRKRALLNALRKDNLSAAPVGHWTQALSRVVGSAADTMEEGQLNRTEKGQTEKAKAELMKVLGIGGAVSPGEPTAAAGATASAPAAAPVGNPSEIGGRLVSDLQRDFGLKPEQAAGVVGNLAHESGNFRTLQEIKPMVPGSRGGFGYAQWTGPRRIAFEQYAHQNGLDPTSYEANYGFLKHELQNTGEGRVLKALRTAGDVNTATQIFSNQFLRPGIPAMESRLRLAGQYAGGGADMPAQGAQTAEQAMQRPAPGQFTTPGQMPSAGNSPSAAAIMAALGNPWAAKNPALQQVAASVLGKQLGRDPVEDALRRVELQTKMRDLTESKPFTIKVDGEDVTVVRDNQGNIRRVQLSGEPAGGQQQKTYKLPDGREVPLPSDPTARKKALEEYGAAGAKSVQNAPQAAQSAAQTISVIDQILGPQNPQTGKFDKPHPGLSWRVGTIYGAVPSMYGTDGAGFDALQKQVSGKAFLEAFDSLKGGGAITEVEGNKAQQAIARLDVKQKPEDYMKALQELREIARTGMERAKIIAAGGNPAAAQPPSATGDGWKEISPGIRIREAR